jgi:hypothetical protein
VAQTKARAPFCSWNLLVGHRQVAIRRAAIFGFLFIITGNQQPSGFLSGLYSAEMVSLATVWKLSIRAEIGCARNKVTITELRN